jgi:hypothetical protein
MRDFLRLWIDNHSFDAANIVAIGSHYFGMFFYLHLFLLAKTGITLIRRTISLSLASLPYPERNAGRSPHKLSSKLDLVLRQ